MGIPLNELQLYKNFDELAIDILEMAKEFMPDRLIYLTTITDNKQIVLKLSENHPSININEGMTINLTETVCNRIDFNRNMPLIFKDIRREACLDDLRKTLVEANINSYLGVPILLTNGEVFGTLCAVHEDAIVFSEKSIKMLQRIAKMFTYYLELERLAYRDSLTGLYNRQFLYKYFESTSTNGGALFFLDLDGFKKINDVLGHDTGDEVLREVAMRLRNYISHQNGFAVRLGGDEFILNLAEIFDKDDISKQAESVLSQLSSWNDLLEGIPLSVSIGIVTYPPGEIQQLKPLLQNADRALYRAKANGKNTYQFF